MPTRPLERLKKPPPMQCGELNIESSSTFIQSHGQSHIFSVYALSYMYSRTFDPDLCNQLSRLLNIIVLHFENTLFFLVSSNIWDYITDNAIRLESFSLTLVLHLVCVKANHTTRLIIFYTFLWLDIMKLKENNIRKSISN